jgi:glycosyltransferase involved in cell wall biosynthesis
MPRLLNVNNYHYRRGGAEVVYFGHGAMFGERGWDVDWFSMKHPQNPPGTDERYFAELIDLDHMKGKVAKARAAAAIVYNRNARERISALVRARRPDIAHMHNIYHHLSPSILGALKQEGVPTVLTAHDLKLACPNYKMLTHAQVCERCKGGHIWNVAVHRCMKNSFALSALIAVESAVHRMLRLYAAHLDRIIAPSRFYRDKLIEWGWPNQRVIYLPNFAPTHFEPTPVPGQGGLLYFGRLSEEKGIATLIQASALSGVPVTIAGTGPNAAEFSQLAETTRAPVTFAGYKTGPQLAELLKQTRAVVLPSEWYENAPMSVLEAYSAGRPVLGAAIGGIPELIIEGESGWTFEAGNTEILAEKMKEVAGMTSHRLSDMGSTGAKMMLGNFDQNSYFSRMDSLYGELRLSPSR